MAAVATGSLLLLMGVPLYGLAAMAIAESRPDSSVTKLSGGAVLTQPLRVVSLNLAHGRKTAINQFFLREQTIRENLVEVAALLRKSEPDVVALQEADGPSFWSGSFDHVAFLATEAGYRWHALAPHAESWIFDYGTALISRTPLNETLRHDFRPSPPTTKKGFMLGTVSLATDEGSIVDIDVVSVHLDFSRESVRQSQADEMAQLLAGRNHPLVVLGDFNSDWVSENSAVRRFAELLGLHAYRPDADNLGTYDAGGDRLDWILLSPQLEFTRYEVLPDTVSDHQIVLAEVQLRPGSSYGLPQRSVASEEAP